MSELTPQEREWNEKIARWVFGKDAELIWSDGDLHHVVHEGHEIRWECCTFTRSLDSLFKHAVPKLQEAIIQIDTYPSEGRYIVTIDLIHMRGQGTAATPALAAAQAVLKIIEGEK